MTSAIVFDLDGTLFDAEYCYARALEAARVPQSPFQLARAEVKGRLPAKHVAARNRLLYFKRLLENENRFHASGLLSMMRDYEQALSFEIGQQWKSLGRAALMSDLKSTGLRLFLLTNENLRTQILKLAAIDPDGAFFDGIVTSEEFGKEKPDLHLFMGALSSWNLKPNDCIMVGDDLEADIRPAADLGMKAIWTTEFLAKPALSQDPTTLTIQRLEDLRTHL